MMFSRSCSAPTICRYKSAAEVALGIRTLVNLAQKSGCGPTVADTCCCAFLDASDVVTAGVDGILLERDAHEKLAASIGPNIAAIVA